jgi:hypothetical protein
MRPALITAAMLGVMHVAVPAAAAPAAVPVASGEGADGGRGATLARAGAADFLTPPGTRQSALVPVAEGGEGGRGRGWRRREYRWDGPYRYREGPPPYGWGPPPRGYTYAPAPPPPRYYGWQPEPPRFPARPPSAGIWIDPGF